MSKETYYFLSLNLFLGPKYFHTSDLKVAIDLLPVELVGCWEHMWIITRDFNSLLLCLTEAATRPTVFVERTCCLKQSHQNQQHGCIPTGHWSNLKTWTATLWAQPGSLSQSERQSTSTPKAAPWQHWQITSYICGRIHYSQPPSPRQKRWTAASWNGTFPCRDPHQLTDKSM